MPPAFDDSPFIPPMPSPYGTQRGVIPSPLSNGEDLAADDEPSRSRRTHQRGPYPYAPYQGPQHTPTQWATPGQWGPPGQGYGPGLTPGRPPHMYAGTPWTGYQPPVYGPPNMYGYTPGHPHPHSAPYPVGPLPSVASPYHPMSGTLYHQQGFLGPYMPGSVPMRPSPLHPEDMGHSFPERPTEEIIRIDSWAVGTHCIFSRPPSWNSPASFTDAPVLTPFQVAILDATLVVNPLLSPPGDNPPADLAYLEYNVLFPVGTARRSLDPQNRSWSAGRSSPATSPRVSKLRIISSHFPWVLEIEASRPAHGVTCLDVLEGIHEQLQHLVSRQHVAALSGAKGDAHRRKLYEVYHYNRSTARDAPGGSLGEGVRRADWLLHNVMFDGLVNDQKYVQEKLGISGPGWKGLRKEKDGKETPKDRLQSWPATLVLRLDQRYSDSDRESIITDVTDATESSVSQQQDG